MIVCDAQNLFHVLKALEFFGVPELKTGKPSLVALAGEKSNAFALHLHIVQNKFWRFTSRTQLILLVMVNLSSKQSECRG